MIAEKTPGLAVGSTTRMAVCQRLAPSASDAGDEVRRHARERVLADREDDRDDRKAHREPDDEAVALVVGDAERASSSHCRASPPKSQLSTNGAEREREPAADEQQRDDDQQLGARPDAARAARAAARSRRESPTSRTAGSTTTSSMTRRPGCARRRGARYKPGDEADHDARQRRHDLDRRLDPGADASGARTATCRARRGRRAGSRTAARRTCP